MALSENAIRRVEQQIDMLEKSLRYLIPGENDLNIYISTEGTIRMEAIQWEKSNVPIANRPRTNIVKLYRYANGNWGGDESAHQNEYLKEQGLLAGMEEKKDA
ncbi:MAG: hypothetical protein IJ188_03090 [Clostridia bacterium]|nr:hypothetical protein [Clostridia bacterium]